MHALERTECYLAGQPSKSTNKPASSEGKQCDIADLCIPKCNVKLLLSQIYLPDVPILIADNKLENGLIRVGPICFTNWVSSKPSNNFIRFLNHPSGTMRHALICVTYQRYGILISLLSIQGGDPDDAVPVYQDEVELRQRNRDRDFWG
jgi:hypothetical protein